MNTVSGKVQSGVTCYGDEGEDSLGRRFDEFAGILLPIFLASLA